MIINSRKLLLAVLLVPMLLAHAPWGQHQVYRQLHMLIMCSKIDKGAYLFTKKLEKTFNIYLPDAKARVARAPHLNRIIDLLKTDQIPLAIISKDLIEKIIEDNDLDADFFKKETKVIYYFPEMVLISNKNFSSKKSLKIFHSLFKAYADSSNEEIRFSNDYKVSISMDEKIKDKIKK